MHAKGDEILVYLTLPLLLIPIADYCTSFQEITNEISAQERSDMYASGGCFIITSRIMIVDLLNGTLPPAGICGLLIPNAHRYSALCIAH